MTQIFCKLSDNIKKNYIYYILGIALMCLWGFTHLYRLGQVPAGLHIDEAGMAYDAFCVLNWGVDRYLNPYPLYFYNLGGGQSAAYVYLCAACIKLFGMDTWVFRIPAVLFSLAAFIFSSLLVNKVLGKKCAFLNAFLFCVLPYYTMMSRFGLDCNLMFGAGTFAIWLTVKALEKDKLWLYFVCGTVWGLSLYTYVLSYIVFPLIILFVVIFMIARGKYKGVIVFTVPLLILALPLIAMVVINVFDLSTIRTSFFTIYKLKNERADELSLIEIPRNILPVLKMLFTTDSAPFDALEKFGTVYWLSVPFFIIGIIYSAAISISKREKTCLVSLLMFIYFIVELLLGAAKSNVAIYNLNGIYLPVLYFIVYGFKAVYKCTVYLSKGIIAACLVLYVVSFVKFEDYYLNKYPASIESNYLFSGRLNEVLDVFDVSIRTYPTYIDAYYLYYMLEKRINPYEVQLTEDFARYDTITFSSVNTEFDADEIEKYDLYVMNRWSVNEIELLSKYSYDTFWTEDYVIFYR